MIGTGLVRPFDSVGHAKYDAPGKSAMARFYEAKGYTVRPDPQGQYGVDLLVEGHGKRFFVEVEVRDHGWTRGLWPHPDLHVVGRKGKYAEYGLPVHVVSLRADLRAALVIHAQKSLTPDRLEACPKRPGQMVFAIPVREAFLIDIPEEYNA